MNDIEKLFEFIKVNALKHKTFGEIVEIQKNEPSNVFFDNFFKNILSEIDIINNKKFLKYKKYIDFLNDSFMDCFEFSGGQNFRFYHSQNVAFLSNLIAEILDLDEKDKELVIIASLFHDIGKSTKAYKNVGADGFKELEMRLGIDHDEIGADMVRDILKNDFDKDFINIVSKTIRNKESGTKYSNILYDADNMSELGEMEIFRSFYYNSCKNNALDDIFNFWNNTNKNVKLAKVNKAKCGEKIKNIMLEKFNITKNYMDLLKK